MGSHQPTLWLAKSTKGAAVFAWLRLRSGSLWPTVLLHASHNLFVQMVFTPLTIDTGYTAYVIDEFGIGLALALALLGYLFWRQRGALARSMSPV